MSITASERFLQADSALPFRLPQLSPPVSLVSRPERVLSMQMHMHMHLKQAEKATLKITVAQQHMHASIWLL